MRLLVTGMNGTVAPRVAEHAAGAGHEVVPWRRDLVPPDDADACRGFVESVAPDGILHLAFGAESWAGLLAQEAGRRGVPFVYTSTAMVFADRPDGPYLTTATRTATDDYGTYKVRCEDAVRQASGDAMVVRLAYQIDPAGAGNNLVAHLDAAAAAGSTITASTRWIPACAFLDDTAAALLSFVTDPEPGVHHLDGNAATAWTYHRIVTALRDELGRSWDVVPGTDPHHDQRLADSHRMRGLDTRLRPAG
jgi:dTDP-4-dehydrorhamnose reductase